MDENYDRIVYFLLITCNEQQAVHGQREMRHKLSIKTPVGMQDFAVPRTAKGVNPGGGGG